MNGEPMRSCIIDGALSSTSANNALPICGDRRRRFSAASSSPLSVPPFVGDASPTMVFTRGAPPRNLT